MSLRPIISRRGNGSGIVVACLGLADAEVGLDLLQRALLGLWIDEEDDDELDGHHRGEDSEGCSVSIAMHNDWKELGDDSVHNPMG